METSNKYKCIIIDDESLARQLIQTHLKNVPEFELLQSFSSAIDAEKYLRENEIDLMFLDIQMPKLSGIDFLKSLTNPPKTIFTTAYSEFALEGYELNVVDYLVKPIVADRFMKAIGKVIEILELEKHIKVPSTLDSIESSIVIKSSHQLIKINLVDVLYIEALHKYIKIVTVEKNYTTLFSMNSIEQEIPPSLFYRCHRSFIVNIKKVEMIDGNQAIIDKYKIPISKTTKEELVLKLGKKIG